jgi:hypothetical protein
MATAQAGQTSSGKAAAPRAAAPVSHRPAAPEPIEDRPAEAPYLPDQFVLLVLVGCVLLILAMNLVDVITAMLNW